jgi:hypothetical protein
LADSRQWARMKIEDGTKTIWTRRRREQ